MKIFFSVGEPSGDLHGANLIRQLKAREPGVEIVGYGGPKMAEAGCHLHADLTQLAVMWFLRALVNIHKFLHLAARADRYFAKARPDAVVLIDYPGFNWWIARRAKAHNIPVFYYTPPQIWAWASWRVRKMRRFVDHVLCSLPFEEKWFREHGCNATFVGHPYFDEVRSQQLDAAFVDRLTCDSRPLVTILPGSRTQEVTLNFPWLLRAASLVHRQFSQVRFAVAGFKPHQADLARSTIEEHAKKTGERMEIEVYTGRTAELIHAATCCMAVSGSVSLELLYHTKPTVVLYWISRLAYFVQTFFRRVKYITLVNLLSTDELFPSDIAPFDPNQPDAHRVLFPEYLTFEDKSAQIAAHVLEWLRNVSARQARIVDLRALRARVAAGGASSAAADYVLAAIARGQKLAHRTPRPHFQPGSSAERSAA
ncbi:MAG: lipid-A-disaccharide synthase [Planctomycetota bacterium]|nr:MAG: lipid-A-disaccharide synthase [Planctomycetota bacterium]